MTPFEYGYWHAWESNGKILLSDERTNEKKLRYFKTVDDAINWLYTNGHQDVARKWNYHKQFTSMSHEIKHHMALAFFCSAFADMQDEKEDGGTNPGPGGDWMDVLPVEIDPAAIHAADTLEMDLARANEVYGRDPLQTLLGCAREIQGRTRTQGDRGLTPEMFGHYLAMQAMGHGVGLGDAFGSAVRKAIKVPHVEFGSYSLEKDY